MGMKMTITVGKALAAVACGLAVSPAVSAAEQKPMTPLDRARLVTEETRPLKIERGDRIPFIVWPLQNVTAETDAELEEVLKKLADRGTAVVTNWNTRNKEASLREALRSAAIHKKLGIPVVVNSTSVMSLFFNGDESTAHMTADGETFFDLSHSERIKIGCPFAAQGRYGAIREQVEYFVKGYHDAGMPLDIVIADWEIDGPIEWNDAWAHAKRCSRCRENIPNIENFGEFQAAYRIIRSEMQRECYAKVVRGYFPEVLVGNYAVYPHNGLRLGDRVLVRRTDFDDTAGPVKLTVQGQVLSVSRADGECQVLRIGRSP